MATWVPISGGILQRVKSDGKPASGYVLKLYAPGTTTNIPMATDATGLTTATTALINSTGDFTVSGNTIIPHIDQDYKLAIYPTQAAADLNSGATVTIDYISTAIGGAIVRSLYLVGETGSLASRVPSNTAVGDLVEVTAYSSTSAKYPATWKCTSISASLPASAVAGDVTGTALGALYVLKTGSTYYKFEIATNADVRAFGALLDGVSDDLPAYQACSDYVGSSGGGKVFVPDGVSYHNDNPATGINQYGWLLRYSNVEIEFSSKASVIKKDGDTASVRKAISIASDTTGNPSSQLSNIVIHGGGIDGGNTDASVVASESSHGIDIRNSQGVEVYGMDILRCRGDGVYIAYGCDNIDVHHNYIDLENSRDGSSNKVYRQGAAILSGTNIRVHENTVKSSLIGIDLEIDDNQIAAGYSELSNINIYENTVKGVTEEGIAVVTPLVTSPVTIGNINIINNSIISPSSTVIEVDIESAAGNGTNFTISGNNSDGSLSFKGISLIGLTGIQICGNSLGSCPDILIEVSTRCANIEIDGNTGVSTGNDAIRCQENVATTRSRLLIGSANSVVSESGDGLQLNGAYEATITGGYYEGTVSGASYNGTSVGGNSTRLIATVAGGDFVCTDAAGYGLVVGASVRRFVACAGKYQSDAAATYAAIIDGSAQGVWLAANRYTLGDDGWAYARTLVSGYATAYIVDFPQTAQKNYDPASIAAGATLATTVTLTGASLGDFVVASFSLSLAGLTLSAYVSAADTVTCVFSNNTAGAIDLASGVLKVSFS